MIRTPTDKEIETFIVGLSEVQFRECVQAVIQDNKKLDDGGRKVLLKLNPYKSPTLRRWVFDSFAGPLAPVAPVAPKPYWPTPQVAADFEVD